MPETPLTPVTSRGNDVHSKAVTPTHLLAILEAGFVNFSIVMWGIGTLL